VMRRLIITAAAVLGADHAAFRSRRSQTMKILTIAALTLATITAASAQTTFRDANGRITGTVTADSNGTKTFRDGTGRTTGPASTDSNGTTTFRDAGGRTTGSHGRTMPRAATRASGAADHPVLAMVIFQWLSIAAGLLAAILWLWSARVRIRWGRDHSTLGYLPSDRPATLMNTETCSLCKGPYDRFGHDAWLLGKGRCCDACYATRVIPARLRRMLDEWRAEHNGRK
jgi:hypothetical protein